MNISDLASATEKRDGAYEIKFVVPTSVAEAALAWARTHLAPDPHADGNTGDGYRVNSLYFETPKLDVYQRNGSYAKCKYRIRRYGDESCLFLERKLKSHGLVSKRRTRVADEELPRLAGTLPDPDWIGYWFGRRLLARQLLPMCQIRYERTARVGMTPDGPIRLTVDRDVRTFRTGEYGVVETGAWVPLLPDHCILELKFRLEMPNLFKSLLEELSLTPQPVSKYRLSIQAFGLDPTPKNGQPVPRNGHASAGALLGDGPPLRLQAAGSSPEA
jgi:VTC domain